jgi:Holliday junction resolvasome RuvABC endonuclease subunit
VKRVVGLDLSLTKSGVAVIVATARNTSLVTETFSSKGKRADSLVERHARITGLGKELLHHAAVADLVVIEGLFTGPNAGSLIDRAALFWWVAGGLIRREVPVAVVPPTSLKLAIAGKGGADKVQVALALAKLWPDADLGNNDSADAAGLAHLGAVWLAMDVPTLERHKQVKAEWPERE